MISPRTRSYIVLGALGILFGGGLFVAVPSILGTLRPEKRDLASRRAFDEEQKAYVPRMALAARIVETREGTLVVKGTATNGGTRVVHRVGARLELRDAAGRNLGAWYVGVVESMIDVAGADPMPLRPGESRDFTLKLKLSDLTHTRQEPPREPLTLIPVVADVQIERNPPAP